nr:hypothetical protein [Tanacetum cinerariifolium]
MKPQGGNAAGYGGAQTRIGNVNPGQARPGQARSVKCYNCNGTWHIARNCPQLKRPQNFKYYKYKMLLMQAQENEVALDAEQLLFLADNVFQADECDAFDSDVDEAPTAQTMFMANLSFVDPITDEAGPLYDSDILSEFRWGLPLGKVSLSSIPQRQVAGETFPLRQVPGESPEMSLGNVELFNRLSQCEKDGWLSLRGWFWSSFMLPYEKKYVDVKFGGKVCLEVECGIEWRNLGAEMTLELGVEMGLRWVYLCAEIGD